MSRPIQAVFMADLHCERDSRGPDKPSRRWLETNRLRKGDPSHPKTGPWLGDLRGDHIDLVVLGGDIHTEMADQPIKSVAVADEVSRYFDCPVALIAGNHEFYGEVDIVRLIPEMREAAYRTHGRVHFLEKDTATINIDGRPVHILGTTLWTDMAALTPVDMNLELVEHLRMYGDSKGVIYDRESAIKRACLHARASLNDFHRIIYDRKPLTPEKSVDLHWEAREWLHREVAAIREAEGDADILIATHHSPVLEGSAPEFRGSDVSPAFVSDMRADIETLQPLSWSFGHTHFSMSEQIGDTQLISEQRGYIDTEDAAANFYPKIVEIPRRPTPSIDDRDDESAVPKL